MRNDRKGCQPKRLILWDFFPFGGWYRLSRWAKNQEAVRLGWAMTRMYPPFKFAFSQPRVYTRTMLPSQCLCINLRRAARGVSRYYDGALDGFGINVAQYSLLSNLARLDQPSISSLAEAMGLDRSTLGRNLRVLEGEGLVALAEGDDLRNRIVVLTETGQARLAAALPAWEAAQQKLIDKLGAEKRATLLALLDELA